MTMNKGQEIARLSIKEKYLYWREEAKDLRVENKILIRKLEHFERKIKFLEKKRNWAVNYRKMPTKYSNKKNEH